MPATVPLAARRALHPHVDQTAQSQQPEPARKMGGTFQRFCPKYDSEAESTLTVRLKQIASNRIRNVAPIIRQAWRLLMENHPHDSICGCSIDQVHDEMRPRFDQVDQIGEEITLQALQAIALAVDTRCARCILSHRDFQSGSAPRRDLVEVDLQVPEEIAAFELVAKPMKPSSRMNFWARATRNLPTFCCAKTACVTRSARSTEGRAAGRQSPA